MITLLALALVGQTRTFTHMSDAQFLRKYAAANMGEIAISQYAGDRTRNDRIKDACDMMIQDHNDALDKIREMARRMVLELPTEMADYERSYLRDMHKMSAWELDRRFAEHMVHDHAGAINDFQIEAKYGRNQWVRNYAADTLPTLREHYRLWQRLSSGRPRRGSGDYGDRPRRDGG